MIFLFTEIKDGNIESVLNLLDSGADINRKDVTGKTPLHYAIEHGYPEIARLLINSGADINACSSACDGWVSFLLPVYFLPYFMSNQRRSREE